MNEIRVEDAASPRHWLPLPLARMVGAVQRLNPWRFFALYLFLLPPHILLMTFLLVHVALPAPVVKAVSAWKEITLAFLLAVALWRLTRLRPRLLLPDWLVILYGLYVMGVGVLIYLEGQDLIVLLYGLRDLLLPVLLYLVGRSLHLSEGRARQVFRWLVVAALLFSITGIVERLFIPTVAHVAFGLPRYYSELLNLAYPEFYLGLPENFWTSANAGRIRRAVGVFGSSQGFALSYLLLLPPLLYALVTRELREHRLAPPLLAVAMVALFLTITRFTIAIAIGLLVITVLFSSRDARRLATYATTLLLAAFLLLLLFSSSARMLALSTVTFQDHSARTRLIVWQRTAETVAQQPFGYGIGTVGQTAVRLDEDGVQLVRTEGQISKVVVELGLQGLGLYLGLLLSITLYLARSAAAAGTPYVRGLCFASALTFLGLLANALTTEWHNSPALVYPALWLAGTCLATGAARLPVPPEEAAPGLATAI
jgi:hypothetical protein